jgi:hypothetical protein
MLSAMWVSEMAETISQKARRYLSEGRLIVVSLCEGEITASCRGSDEDYWLGFDPKRQAWWCACPARSRCCHLEALQLVTRRPAQSFMQKR